MKKQEPLDERTPEGIIKLAAFPPGSVGARLDEKHNTARIREQDLTDALERGSEYADLLRRIRAMLVIGPLDHHQTLSLCNVIYNALQRNNDHEEDV